MLPWITVLTDLKKKVEGPYCRSVKRAINQQDYAEGSGSESKSFQELFEMEIFLSYDSRITYWQRKLSKKVSNFGSAHRKLSVGRL